MLITAIVPCRRTKLRAGIMMGLAASALFGVRNAGAGLFDEGDVLMLQAAPGVVHFDYDPEHAKHSWLIGLERQSPSRWVVGAAYFNNSFNQKCEYLYFGKYWPLDFIDGNAYFKLTGGLLLGYKEPYEDKIPFNSNGIAPGAVPGLGYRYGNFNAQINLLGGAGLMVTFGYNIIQW